MIFKNLVVSIFCKQQGTTEIYLLLLCGINTFMEQLKLVMEIRIFCYLPLKSQRVLENVNQPNQKTDNIPMLVNNFCL